MMTEVKFRRAVASDLTAIVALLADDELGRTREDASLPIRSSYVDAFTAIDEDANQFLAVAVLGDQVIGTLQLSFMPGISRLGAWRGQIEAVRISADHRGDGLGQRVFLWAIDMCRSRNCDFVQLTTDITRDDAHRFYERIGFKKTHLGYKMKLA